MMGLVRLPLMLVRLASQTVLLAVGQVLTNKVRSGLTTLGIVIGVASIIAVVAAMDGLRTGILSEFEKFGSRKVFIDGTRPNSMRHRVTWREVKLQLDEVEAIAEHAPSIEFISPQYGGSYDIEYGDIKLDSMGVLGIWPIWHEVEGRAIIQGRPFNTIDELEQRLVCVINDMAIEELELPIEPVGTSILLGGRRFLIVGVVETIQLSGMLGGGDTNTEVYIPFSTSRLLNPNGWINFATAEMTNTNSAEDAIAEISFVLRMMRGLEPEDEDTYRVWVVQQFIDGFNRVAAGITAGAGGIVGIALLVGGIGIMNIMLVSVSERTREIGLRKAVGAKPMVIMLQFLVEAVTLCLIGGAIGLAIGQLLVLGMRAIPDSPLSGAQVPLWAVLLSVGFSAATGIVFGMFPAIKAARLDPIDALRHE